MQGDGETHGPSALRLFLSVDIVGSTEYKTVPTQRDFALWAWLPVFFDFYGEFPTRLKTRWNAACEYGDLDAGRGPQFWKGIGDELVFTCELVSHQHAFCALKAFITAMNGYATKMQTEHGARHLDLKGTAWICGFPVGNVEIDLEAVSSGLDEPTEDQIRWELLRGFSENTAHHQHFTDYLGPTVDLGFRLTKFAKPGLLIVSAGLALLLIEGNKNPPGGHDQLPFAFLGTRRIKGAMQHRPYPIIGILVPPNGPVAEAEQKIRPVADSVTDAFLQTYIDQYIEANSDLPHVHEPYLTHDEETVFTTVPESHAKYLDRLQDLRAEEERLDEESATPDELPAEKVSGKLKRPEMDEALSAVEDTVEGTPKQDTDGEPG